MFIQLTVHVDSTLNFISIRATPSCMHIRVCVCLSVCVCVCMCMCMCVCMEGSTYSQGFHDVNCRGYMFVLVVLLEQVFENRMW